MKKTEAEMLANQWDVDNMTVDPETLATYVRYEVDEQRATATITFDRPDRLNAIPVAAFERVGDLVREAESDDRVKVIIFKGEGEHFGTGADAAELGHYIGYKSGTDKASRRRPAACCASVCPTAPPSCTIRSGPSTRGTPICCAR